MTYTEKLDTWLTEQRALGITLDLRFFPFAGDPERTARAAKVFLRRPVGENENGVALCSWWYLGNIDDMEARDRGVERKWQRLQQAAANNKFVVCLWNC